MCREIVSNKRTMMIHTRKLKFKYNNIDFEAKVTYSDEVHKSAFKKSENIFYSILLVKPIVLNCGGETVSVRNWMTAMSLANGVCGKEKYFYEEDKNLRLFENKINIYPIAVKNIIYYYFNRDKIKYYHAKIDKIRLEIDHKYNEQFKDFSESKKDLKRELKSEIIDAKSYQKQLTLIYKNKSDLKLKVLELKEKIYKKYFDCGILRDRYGYAKAYKCMEW